MKPSFLIAGIGLALAIIFALQYWQGNMPTEDDASETPITAPQTSLDPVTRPAVDPGGTVDPEPAAPQPPLPSLDDSDDYLRELLASYDLPAAWLEPEQLLRRLATLLDNAATGSFPKQQLGFMAPEGDFAVKPAGRYFQVNPQSYARFDLVVAALESLEVQTLAGWYRRLEPLLGAALAELGQAEAPDLLLAKAIAEVAMVPALTGDEVLVRPRVLYRYQDPALEQLKPLQKQLLRMGPDNVARIQGYLVELKEVLALPEQG